ncbi:MAG: AraC family transcriptional regulator [Bacteroidota bacterium]
MYDHRMIGYRGRPLFQVAKMRSPGKDQGTLVDVACFYYILKGSTRVIEGNGLFASQKQEGLLKSCGSFIGEYFPDEDGSDFEALVIFLYPDMLREIYKDQLPAFPLKDAKAHAPRNFVGNELVSRFIESLFIYFDNESLMDEELAKLKLKELVMILLKSQYFDGVVDFFKSLFAPKNTSFREVIENNLFNDLSVEQLAFLTHKSVSSFKRVFKKEFGETPARYIKSRRLEAAAGKLLVSKDPVSAIAYDCGFQDVTTFSASFREKFSMPPSQYRLTQIRK